jgi:hypothetical protein
MVAAELDEALVEGVSDHVVVVGTWKEGTEQKGFELKGGAHAAELEVSEPELFLCELSVPAELVEHVVAGRTHKNRCPCDALTGDARQNGVPCAVSGRGGCSQCCGEGSRTSVTWFDSGVIDMVSRPRDIGPSL